MIARICDAGQRADSAIGRRQGSCLPDDCAAIFFSPEALRKRAGVHARDGKNVVGPQVVQIQPEHQFAEELNGGTRRDAVVI